eukprot:gene3650-6466_t
MQSKLLVLFALFISYAVAQEELHGARNINRGYDFHQGGQVPIEKAKAPIYKYDYSAPRYYSPPTRPDIKFKYPKELIVRPQIQLIEFAKTNKTLTIFRNKTSEFMQNFLHIAKYEVSRSSFGLSLNVIKFAVGFQYAKEYGKIKEILRSKITATTRGVYYRSLYRVDSLPPMFMKLGDDYKLTVDYLPVKPTPGDKEKYENVLDYFGGFYLQRGIFGGRVRLFTFLKQEITRDRDEKWTSTQLQLSFHYNMFGVSGGGFRRRQDIKIDEHFKKFSESFVAYTGGFRKFHDQDKLKEWEGSVNESQDLLEGDMKPLSDHINNSPVKKKNFEQIIKKYSEEGKVIINNVITADSLLGYSFDAKTMSIQHPVVDSSNVLSTGVASSIVMQSKNITYGTESKQDFQKYISKDLVSEFKKGYASWTRDLIELEENENIHIAERKIVLRELKLKSMPTKYSVKFNEAIEMLPSKFDEQIYLGFVEAWGTHFVNSVQIGGSIKVSVQLKKSFISEISSQDESKQILKNVIENSKYNFKKDSNIEKLLKDNLNVKVHYKGGRRVSGWNQFIQSVKQEPEVLKFGIIPLSSMIKDDLKRQNLEKFIQQYFE